ncbi:hypothetical protein ILT44_22780 [Microvirga sp. BT689]|uniref:DUF6894 family protein n=1 Tax=Microvirga arvi TaxID=2778731 RepID=UPI00194DF2F5|nr:hypothetical protein [Microvirga arvi]MBM6583034.1 hypothetical protein [Microvirga arvi]
MLYYFDIRKGTDLIRDDKGSEFASQEAAARGTARSAAEIGAGQLAKSDFSDVVEVRDERNQRLCTVTASMKDDWHTPLAPASFLERVSTDPANRTWRQAAARISSAGPKNS